jgi:hypothetical protein
MSMYLALHLFILFYFILFYFILFIQFSVNSPQSLQI